MKISRGKHKHTQMKIYILIELLNATIASSCDESEKLVQRCETLRNKFIDAHQKCGILCITTKHHINFYRFKWVRNEGWHIRCTAIKIP